MSKWTDEQLLSAYDCAAALVGWPMMPAGNAGLDGVVRKCYAGITWRIAAAASAAHGVECLEASNRWRSEASHFCRRIREALHVDEPAWKRPEWIAPDPGGKRYARIDEWLLEADQDAGIGEWCARLQREEDDGWFRGIAATEAPVDSADAACAAAHDLLIAYHLSGLRAAMGGER